jgi:hypothetical protein
LTRPVRPADPAAGTTATGWCQAATRVRGRASRRSYQPRGSPDCVLAAPPSLTRHARPVGLCTSGAGAVPAPNGAVGCAGTRPTAPLGGLAGRGAGEHLACLCTFRAAVESCPANGAVDPAGTGSMAPTYRRPDAAKRGAQPLESHAPRESPRCGLLRGLGTALSKSGPEMSPAPASPLRPSLQSRESRQHPTRARASPTPTSQRPPGPRWLRTTCGGGRGG